MPADFRRTHPADPPFRPAPWRGLAVALLLCFGILPAGAQDLVSDRPDFTESAQAVAPGRVQVEAGLSVEEAGDTDSLAVGEVLVRVGLASGLELRLAPGSYERLRPAGDGSRSADGLGDASLGLKAVLPAVSRLFPDAAEPRAALLVDVELPTGKDELGEDGLRPGAILALAWDLGPRAGLGVNLGYRRSQATGQRYDQLSASLAVGWAVAGDVSAFAEWFAVEQSPGGGGDGFAQHLDGGLTWLLTDDLQVDAYLGVGLNDEAPDRFAGLGLVARF